MMTVAPYSPYSIAADYSRPSDSTANRNTAQRISPAAEVYEDHSDKRRQPRVEATGEQATTTPDEGQHGHWQQVLAQRLVSADRQTASAYAETQNQRLTSGQVLGQRIDVRA